MCAYILHRACCPCPMQDFCVRRHLGFHRSPETDLRFHLLPCGEFPRIEAVMCQERRDAGGVVASRDCPGALPEGQYDEIKDSMACRPCAMCENMCLSLGPKARVWMDGVLLAGGSGVSETDKALG